MLRKFVIEDMPALMALNAEAATRRWLPSHVYPSREDAQAALRFLINCYSSPCNPRAAPFVLAIELGRTGELLGHVGFSPLGEDVEVSYAVAELARGRGYATEALLAACSWVASTFDIPTILAITATENHPARRVLERSSFAHAHNETMLFQGSEQAVSRYTWQVPQVRKTIERHNANAGR